MIIIKEPDDPLKKSRMMLLVPISFTVNDEVNLAIFQSLVWNEYGDKPGQLSVDSLLMTDVPTY